MYVLKYFHVFLLKYFMYLLKYFHVLHLEESQVVEVAGQVDQTVGYEGAKVVALFHYGGWVVPEENRDLVLLYVIDNSVDNLLLLLVEATHKVEGIIQS